MFQAFAEGLGVDYQIFRDQQAAMDWLGPPPAS